MKKESQRKSSKSTLKKSILKVLYDSKIPFNPASKKTKQEREQLRKQKMKHEHNDDLSPESSFLFHLLKKESNLDLQLLTSDTDSDISNISVQNKIQYFESKSYKQSRKLTETPTTYNIAKSNQNLFSKKYNNPIKAQASLKINHFALMCTLGRGSFGRVLLAFHKQNDKFYAVKVLNKEKLVNNNQIIHSINERNILFACDHPNILKLYASFKDNTNIYFVTDVFCNKDLYKLLKRYENFDEQHAKFLSANIFLALEYLHVNDVIYRDLKPENCLITNNGYLKLADFGFAKKITDYADTMCGTPDYISPEVLSAKPYGKSVDWWAFGIFVYEMNNGKPPFNASTEQDTNALYQLIMNGSYKIPSRFSDELADLCKKLIEKNVKQRLGCLKRKSNDIRDHPWFSDIDWMALYYQKIPAPYLPRVKSPKDVIEKNSDKSEDPLIISKINQFKNEFEEF